MTQWSKNKRWMFEQYRSEICHQLKRLGDLEFVIAVVENNLIPTFWKWKWYPEAFYLLAIIDYLSDIYKVDRLSDYNEFRSQKLKYTLFPQSVLIEDHLFPSKHIKEQVIEKCTKDSCSKYFMVYNIVEGDIRDVA